MTTTTTGQRVTFTHNGRRYGYVVAIDTDGMATIVFGTSADDPEGVTFPHPVHVGRLAPVDGEGNRITAGRAYCDRAHPGSDAEADRWCEMYHTDPDSPIAEPEAVAWDRDEQDSCERGTPGCSVRHTRDSECATW